MATSYSTTAANTLTISGFTNPPLPGSYPISINLYNGASLFARQTYYLTVTPKL